jgi:hypothetical protein
MKKADMVYIDDQGQEWITGEAVANLWNKRTVDEFNREGRYTRWAARNRVVSSGDLPYIDLEHGRMYSKSAAELVKLRPRSKPRPDVTQRNIDNKPFTKKAE